MTVFKITGPNFTKKDAEELMNLLDEFLHERGETDSPEGKLLRQMMTDNIAAFFGSEQNPLTKHHKIAKEKTP